MSTAQRTWSTQRTVRERAAEVRQVDAGEPEAGGFELGRRGEHRLALPDAVQAVDTGALDDAAAELLAAFVVRAFELEPEQPLDEALGVAALDAVALHRFVDLLERGDEPAPDGLEHEVGVAVDHRRESLQLFAR